MHFVYTGKCKIKVLLLDINNEPSMYSKLTYYIPGSTAAVDPKYVQPSLYMEGGGEAN